MAVRAGDIMSKGRKKERIYVTPERAVFILYSTAFLKREISLVWYMTWPIRPLLGTYRTIPSLYDQYGHVYTAEQLRDYYVVLAIPITPENKHMAEEWKGKKIVIWGYEKDQVVIE